MTGTDVATYTRERPGMSAFVLEDGVVYHTYSAYARTGRPLGHVPVARPRPQGPQRDGLLVAPPRRIRVASSERRLVLPRGGGARVNTRDTVRRHGTTTTLLGPPRTCGGAARSPVDHPSATLAISGNSLLHQSFRMSCK